MFKEDEAVEEDNFTPNPEKETIIKKGDLLELGNHRLLCGDSTSEVDVSKLVGTSLVDMVLTDPPYGVSYVGGTSDALTIENDDLEENELAQLVLKAFDRADQICRPGGYWYATVPAGPLHILFAEDWKKRGILRQIMVWVKDSLVLGHSEYHYQHEPILFGWKEGKRHKNSDRTRTTVWSYDRPKANREHPTMKPIPLWGQAIRDGSIPGEIVYDCFLGSGTTLIAADQLNRRCFGLELSPKYCQVIVDRYKSHCETTNKPFICKLNGEDVSDYICKMGAEDSI
jgi:DNA modification methylase